MRTKLSALRWALGATALLLLFTSSSGISVRKIKGKAIANEHAQSKNVEVEQAPHQSEDYRKEDTDEGEVMEPPRIAKKAENLPETKPVKSRKVSKSKEDSPLNVDVIRPTDLREEEVVEDDNGEELAKADRETRGDKNPRLYYDDATPRYPSHHRQPHSHHHHQQHQQHQQHHVEEGDFEGSISEGKEKEEGKFYFPKNYMSQFGQGHKGIYGLPGKRAPDHVEFDVNGHHHHQHQHHHPAHHEYHVGHGPSHSLVSQHHTEEHGPVEHDTPYGHDVEEHSVKGKGHNQVAVYGGFHHGGYRHTIGDKVDVLGKALRVLVPSALLVTGVSALFPNRIHVPTTPNKYRQKRSVFRRRTNRGGVFLPPPPPSPMAQMSPEFQDIPTRALHAEHRIMDGEPIDIYPEYGHRYAASSHSQMSNGFDPFKVFKGPGPEYTIQRLSESIVLPSFPELPEMATLSGNNNQYHVHTRYPPEPTGEEDMPSSTYGPDNVVPPTANTIVDTPTTQMSMSDGTTKRGPFKRRKTTRKPPVYQREKNPEMEYSSQQLMETHKQNYLVKNALEIEKQTNPAKAEEEFMTTLQNLVTPDVAKAIVENKQDPPKNVDLSPDGPVMGLLTSYAQHEKDSPNCQKRALCELAVKGKGANATKFEAFLWSVATLVPDVFSEMYDLQEVFQGIREERCTRFDCPNPNLDLQLN